ncbi:DUF4349 domain-containing protein [Micromonospora sp. WMMD882]|uniref:DUF4349 domain-containing protein n=1 Tax=Micromonospora sp. WMMD882 TaxID=3015151 RepID=UPI00248BBE0C|nr:DUF4349 domain-containing protein [Micromonospora sp. WMMD882]WBB77506.1 DUF4349 domain-containing protein [Micromonospora sp. WMMD882]
MVDIGRRRWGAAALTLGLAAALAVSGCSSSDSGGDENAADAPANVPPAAAPEQGDADQGGDAAATQRGGAGADLRVDQRAIVYRGSIMVEVKDVDQAAREVTALATAVGGFVGGDQRRTVDSDARAELELRVPAAKFTGAVDEVAKLGRQQRREIHTEDVTEETVDLDARIVTQRARVDNARRLLSRATSIGDLVSLENELGRREADLASLEAKKRRLADLTALSTLTVTLVGPNARPVETGESGFWAGLTESWRVFLESVTVLVTLIGALLPWLVAFGLPAWLAWRLLRRRRRPTSPAPTAGPLPRPRVGPMPPAPAGGPGPYPSADGPGDPSGPVRPAGGPTGTPTGQPTSATPTGTAPGVSGPPPAPGARSAP